MAEQGSRLPAFASDAWMLEQQVRAEVEAEGWRRLREDLSRVPVAAPQAEAVEERPRRVAGGAILKAIVRFGIGVFGAYLGFIAAMDSGLGEFEVWLAVGAGFIISLALTAFGPGRSLVVLLAETMRWAILIAAGVGLMYVLATQLTA